MSLMEQFSNPETMHALSFGDKMLGSTVTMLMGMGVTFLILCILWAFIAIMGKVMAAVDTKKVAPAAAAAAPAAAPAPAAAAPAAADAPAGEDADVIAAVIAAAIAAYGGGDEIKTNLVVRKIVRIPSTSTPWSVAARTDVIDSRRF